MTDPVRVGIAGLGFDAEFIPIYRDHPDAEMYSICQRSEDSLNSIGTAFGIEHRFTSFEKMIADPELDAVRINTPIPTMRSTRSRPCGQESTSPVPCRWP